MRYLIQFMFVTAVLGVDPTNVAVTAPDPTAAIVAEGRFLYRQRDLDALMMIAKNHNRNRLSETDNDTLRQAMIRLLTAREAFIDALTGLPPAYTGKARDELILDLVDYQAEVSSRPIDPANVSVAPVTSSKDPMIVRLPPLTVPRVIKGQKRQLNLNLALFFQDPTLAKKLEAQAPVIQDAILSTVQKLADAQFIEAEQAVIKDALVKAVQAKIPEFPADGILIPQMDNAEIISSEPSK